MLFWVSYMHVFRIFIFALAQCCSAFFTWKGILDIQSLIIIIIIIVIIMESYQDLTLLDYNDVCTQSNLTPCLLVQ